jgi:hypothetical protein
VRRAGLDGIQGSSSAARFEHPYPILGAGLTTNLGVADGSSEPGSACVGYQLTLRREVRTPRKPIALPNAIHGRVDDGESLGIG